MNSPKNNTADGSLDEEGNKQIVCGGCELLCDDIKEQKLILPTIIEMINVSFKFHLKFWNTAIIGIQVRSLLLVDRLLSGILKRQDVHFLLRSKYMTP